MLAIVDHASVSGLYISAANTAPEGSSAPGLLVPPVTRNLAVRQ
jgi:hypothetical protein